MQSKYVSNDIAKTVEVCCCKTQVFPHSAFLKLVKLHSLVMSLACHGLSSHRPTTNTISKISICDSLWGESTDGRWIPLAKCHQCGMCFHDMMISCCNATILWSLIAPTHPIFSRVICLILNNSMLSQGTEARCRGCYYRKCGDAVMDDITQHIVHSPHSRSG